MAILQAIDATNIDHAVDLLARGFPDRPPEWWRWGVERAASFVAPETGWPVGYLLMHEGRPAGVLLTLASRRPRDAEGDAIIVNLSSWYIDPDARGGGLFMLRQVLQQRSSEFTDTAPRPAVVKMLHVLGFREWTDTVVLLTWPQTLLGGGTSSRIVGLDRIPKDALSAAQRRMLEDHERLGCIVGAFDNGSSWRPLIFAQGYLKHVCVRRAALIYADSRQEVLARRRSVAQFLLKRGVVLFSISVKEPERPPGALYRKQIRLARGDIADDRVDYAYSEYAFFDLLKRRRWSSGKPAQPQVDGPSRA